MKRITIASLAVLLVGALLIAGCGAKTSSTSTSGQMTPQQVIHKSNQKMQGVKSFKATGNIDAKGGSESGAFDYEMQMNVANPNDPQGVMLIKGGGQDMKAYIAEGNEYMYVAGKGWYKQPMGQGGVSSQPPTPAEMAKFSEDAENLKFLSDSGTSYQVSFDIGSKYFEKSIAQSPEFKDPKVQKLMEGFTKSIKMSAVFKINKSTLYLEDVTLKMSTEDMPTVGKMSVDMSMAFSDYNVPVDVSLPPEARNAQEMPTSQGGAPGLPEIPGL